MAVPSRPNSLPVVFRVYPASQGGEVIALFPTLPADVAKPGLCTSYMRVGQHGAADPHLVMRTTKPASRLQYAKLAAELRAMGYKLVAYRRIQGAHHDARRAEWDAQAAAARRQAIDAEAETPCDDPACAIASMPGECLTHAPAETSPDGLCAWCGEEPAHYRLSGRSQDLADPAILLEPVDVCYGCGSDPGHGWLPALLPKHTDDPRAACLACSPSTDTPAAAPLPKET